MGLLPDVDTVLRKDSGDLANQHRAAVQLRRVAPMAGDGTPGTIVLVDSGSSAKLYIKGKNRWWYYELEKE